MSDPQALHAALEEIAEDCLGSPPLMALHDAVRAVLKLHGPVTSTGGPLQCEHCADQCHSGSGLSCESPCDAEYPCDTVKVISAALGVTTDG